MGLPQNGRGTDCILRSTWSPLSPFLIHRCNDYCGSDLSRPEPFSDCQPTSLCDLAGDNPVLSLCTHAAPLQLAFPSVSSPLLLLSPFKSPNTLHLAHHRAFAQAAPCAWSARDRDKEAERSQINRLTVDRERRTEASRERGSGKWSLGGWVVLLTSLWSLSGPDCLHGHGRGQIWPSSPDILAASPGGEGGEGLEALRAAIGLMIKAGLAMKGGQEKTVGFSPSLPFPPPTVGPASS